MGVFDDIRAWAPNSEARQARRAPSEVRTLTKQNVPDALFGGWLPFNRMPRSDSAINDGKALSLGPVFAANRLLASNISTLPVKAYRDADVKVPAPMPALFRDLIANGDLVPWLFKCVISISLRGNAVGWVLRRDGMGFPTMIEWLNPTEVQPDDRPNSLGGWLWNGRVIPAEDIFHIPFFVLPGSRMGMSPIAAYAATLDIGIGAQDFASEYYENGGTPPGTFQNVEKQIPDPATADEIKSRLIRAIKTRQPLVYGKDWQWHGLSVSPGDALFVETMKLTTNQIAAIYGIPPEMIGGETGNSMTYANVEQQQINFVTFTLRPWLVLLESAFSSILPERQYVKFNANALIRADLKTRWEVHQIAHSIGAHSVDDIRALEDEAPLPNGQGATYGPPPALNANPNGESNAE